jgi:hypothetical protein
MMELGDTASEQGALGLADSGKDKYPSKLEECCGVCHLEFRHNGSDERNRPPTLCKIGLYLTS